MLRRSIVVFLILALVVSVSISAFAADDYIDYNDFIVNIVKDGDYDLITADIPVDSLTPFWRLWGAKSEILIQTSDRCLTFDTSLSTRFMATCMPIHERRISCVDIPYGTPFTVYFDVLPTSDFLYPVEEGKLDIYYFNSAGTQLGEQSVGWTSADLYQNSFTTELNIPEGAVSFSISITFKWLWPLAGVSQYTLSITKLQFDLSISSLLRQEQMTGKTNKLLEQIQTKLDDMMNREPEPVEPTWGESAGDAEDKEDQIIDQLDPDKVTNDLADMHLTLVDNLLLYTNAFAAISAIWVVLIDLPFIKIILYCSLLFGLLAAFLGMGIAVGRASDRHSGRSSGKKGK